MKIEKSYVLRGIPPALWIAAKHYAADSGKTLKQIIFEALAAYIAGGKK